MVRAIYRKLAHAWGQQHWWPAETQFEVIVGAVLTQNTSWINVERAMANLRSAGVLHIAGIRGLDLDKLQSLIRPSGYFRQKAQRLKSFVSFVDQRYGGSLEKMFATPTHQLRTELLSLKGIGPETADAILLYAGNREVFVVDAYARRILERHEATARSAKYDEVRDLVERALHSQRLFMPVLENARSLSRPQVHQASVMSAAPRSFRTQVYNEMHGLLVQVGKHYCHRQQPKCNLCPLCSLLPRQASVIT